MRTVRSFLKPQCANPYIGTRLPAILMWSARSLSLTTFKPKRGGSRGKQDGLVCCDAGPVIAWNWDP